MILHIILGHPRRIFVSTGNYNEHCTVRQGKKISMAATENALWVTQLPIVHASNMKWKSEDEQNAWYLIWYYSVGIILPPLSFSTRQSCTFLNLLIFQCQGQISIVLPFIYYARMFKKRFYGWKENLSMRQLTWYIFTPWKINYNLYLIKIIIL